MALGLPKDQRSQIMLILVILALGGGYAYYSYVHSPASDAIDALSHKYDSLSTVVDKAKADLANGSVEDLRRRADEYAADLVLMRQLVPEKNDVPNLLDDISNKMKIRGVTQQQFSPASVDRGSPFDTYQYKLSVYGHYDQLGEFFADIASMPRIVVPQNVSLKPATPNVMKLLGDTLGGLLQADLTLRTFVKAASPPAPAKKPAAAAPPKQGAAQ
ncbi:MAG TPA: type 4a pilus biogenesis protein PilO [Gemmatimonadales bacterium]|jgi:type IV pilus assembly protein PilO|nr:type 4a pilus biogenesis protein PilO [Gemmatimonadales bacterium]